MEAPIGLRGRLDVLVAAAGQQNLSIFFNQQFRHGQTDAVRAGQHHGLFPRITLHSCLSSIADRCAAGDIKIVLVEIEPGNWGFRGLPATEIDLGFKVDV